MTQPSPNAADAPKDAAPRAGASPESAPENAPDATLADAPQDAPLADSLPDSWVEQAPEAARPYLRLARWDRPVGYWLLVIPAFAGVLLANAGGGFGGADVGWLALMAFGAAAVRGAGCTFNDIIDKDLDAQVARTAQRPLAAGVLSVRQAWIFLGVQAAAAFIAFLLLPGLAKVMALIALPIIGVYPFMKRIMPAPQAWLAIAMPWGVWVGYAAAAGHVDAATVFLFLGLAAWTFGYDTIYAHMDKDDDAKAGVGSTAQLFGARSRLAVGLSYAVSAGLVGMSVWMAEGPRPVLALVAAMTVLAFGTALSVQVRRVDFDDRASCLAFFRLNTRAGTRLLLMLAAAPLFSSLV